VSRAIHTAEVMDLDDLLREQRGKPAPSGSLKGLHSIFRLRPDEALRSQKTHPLCPMGYEEFLRALGDALDRRHAQAVLITELDDKIHVEYTVERADFVVRNGQRMVLPGRRQESYAAQQIPSFVQTSRQRGIEQVQRSGQQLSFNPMDVGSYLAAAPVLEDHGHYREAEDLYRTALDIAPQHPEVHYHLACHARRRGDRKAALKHVERAIAHSSGEGRYFHLLGRLNVERNNLEDAQQALQRAISCDPDNPVYHLHLRQVYEQLGRDGEASGRVGAEGEGAPNTWAALWDDAETTQQGVGVAPLPGDSVPPTHAATAAPDAPGASRQAPGDSSAPHLSPDDYHLAPDAPQRSLAARLEERVPPTDEEPVPRTAWEPRPTTSADPVTSGPFEEAAPAWESGRFALPALPPHVEPQVGGEASSAGAPGDEFGGDGLPTLGLGLTEDWSTQRLPALEVPADGAAAAAALPLAGVNLDRPLPDVAAAHDLWTPADVTPALAGTTEDAVQLAAAILRAEELVRAEPHRADLHRKLGFLLAKQGRSEDAAAEFRRAVECGRRRVNQ
jgi:tetratricopeptide (TPR) repeat protein